MNLTVSPQIRILAIVGLVAALGLGASTFVLGGHNPPTQAPTTTAPVQRRRSPAAPTPPRAATKPHAASRPVATKHVAKTQHRAKPAGFRGNQVYAQLPRPLQWQLAHHKVVVVSLYSPRSDVDAISVAEAHAGAVAARAGFLLVNVLDNQVAGILTALLPGGGLLPDPGVLVYRAPGNLAFQLDGFNDRDAVAQAATNALAGQTDGSASQTSSTTAAATPAPAPAPTTTTP